VESLILPFSFGQDQFVQPRDLQPVALTGVFNVNFSVASKEFTTLEARRRRHRSGQFSNIGFLWLFHNHRPQYTKTTTRLFIRYCMVFLSLLPKDSDTARHHPALPGTYLLLLADLTRAIPGQVD